jgi:malonyl-CoA O-methyltransferase
MIALTYPGPEKMFGELARNGALGMIRHEQSDDTEAVAELIRAQWIETYGPGACTLSYEVIFGTAFGPPEGQPRKTPDGDVATFSVDSLKNARRE